MDQILCRNLPILPFTNTFMEDYIGFALAMASGSMRNWSAPDVGNISETWSINLSSCILIKRTKRCNKSLGCFDHPGGFISRGLLC